MSALLELKTLYRDGRILPFIGAGISASVEWIDGAVTKRGPSWGALVDRAAKELGFDSGDLLRVRGTDLQILEYYKLKFSGHTRLTNWLLLNMNPPDDAIKNSVIHNELAAMTNCLTMYTTNFDDFIERSLGLHSRAFQAVAIEEHMRRSSATTEVIKFHGDWNHPDRMVLTESDYERRDGIQIHDGPKALERFTQPFSSVSRLQLSRPECRIPISSSKRAVCRPAQHEFRTTCIHRHSRSFSF
jgi:hypothetical protein